MRDGTVKVKMRGTEMKCVCCVEDNGAGDRQIDRDTELIHNTFSHNALSSSQHTYAEIVIINNQSDNGPGRRQKYIRFLAHD